jgi:hypothetical protein
MHCNKGFQLHRRVGRLPDCQSESAQEQVPQKPLISRSRVDLHEMFFMDDDSWIQSCLQSL